MFLGLKPNRDAQLFTPSSIRKPCAAALASGGQRAKVWFATTPEVIVLSAR